MKILILTLLSLGLFSCAKQKFNNIRWDLNSKTEFEAPKEFNQQATTTSNNKFNKVQFSKQEYLGLEIDNSFLKKVYLPNGKMVFARGQYLPSKNILQQEIAALLKSKNESLNKLKDKLPYLKKFNIEEFDLVISYAHHSWGPNWRLIYVDQQGITWKMFVDQKLSTIQIRRLGSQFHETVANVFPLGPRKSNLQEVVLQELSFDGALASQSAKVNTLSPSKISTSNEALKFNPPDERFDVVQVFYMVNKSMIWFKSNLGFELPSPLDVDLHVGYPEKTNAAFYYGGKIRFGSGDDVTYSKIPQDPSIVIHETVHAFVDHTARLPFEGEGGSLNEAYADFITTIQLDHPNMGEVAYLKGPYKRSVDNSLVFSDRNGGLYHDSLIVSGLLWDIKKQVGSAKSLELAVKVLNLLSPTSDFTEFSSFLNSVVEKELTGAELEKVKSVLVKRGFH